MILNKFRDKSIKKIIEKELVNSDKPLIHISDKKINSVLVLIDESFPKNSKQIIADELSLEMSKIKVVKYIRKAAKEEVTEGFLTDKNFNLFGKIKSESIQKILNSEFDLLINLSENNLLLNYLVVLSNARFKVGFSSADNRLYDFMVAVDTNDLTVFSEELKKYLEILNKL